MADGPFEDDTARMDMRPLWRIAAWGAGAAAALAVAVLVSRSDIGERRVALALATRSEAADPARAAAQLLAKANESEREARRLAELARTLSAERDKLATRIAALEQSLEDLTGSITLTQPARRPPSTMLWRPPTAPGSARPFDEPPSPPATVVPAEAANPPPAAAPQASVEPVADPPPERAEDIPLPRPNPLAVARLANAVPEAARPRAGIDLGGATSVEGLRALWGRIRDAQAPLIGDLQPVMAVREGAGTVELRLVAGPLPNAAAAARLCASLAAVGIACRPAGYDGQRLATR